MATTTAAETPKTRGLTRLSEAEKEMVEANMGLVYSIARAMDRCRLDEKDREQAGMLGLMRASQMFKPELGTKFSTYASYHIKVAIRRADYQDTTIRTPNWTANKPPDREKARRLSGLAEFARSAISLDAFEDDQTACRNDPAAPMERAEGYALLHRSLAALPARLRRVLTARCWAGETLKEIGKKEGLTAEAVRLWERSALGKLRDALAPEFMEGN